MSLLLKGKFIVSAKICSFLQADTVVLREGTKLGEFSLPCAVNNLSNYPAVLLTLMATPPLTSPAGTHLLSFSDSTVLTVL